MADDTQLLGYIRDYLQDNDAQLIDPADLRYVLAAMVQAKASVEDLANFAQLAGAHFSGLVEVPTAPAGTNSQQAASTAFVQAAVAAIASGKNLSELVLPQDVAAGNWYLTTDGFWEARRTFSATAAPANGPNWRLVASFTGQLTTISAANITDATDAGRQMLLAPTAAAQRALVNNPRIAAGQYGNHPAFSSEDGPNGLYAWLIKSVMTVAGVQVVSAPAAPTNGQVNDVSKEFSLTANPAYPNYSQYKVNGLPGTTGPVYLSAANAYQVGSTIYVRVGSAVLRGNLAIYVAGTGNIPDGAPLVNGDAFTGAATTTPPTPTTTALTVSLAIAVASIMAGNPLAFTVTGGGGTGPYTYAVIATNTVTGSMIALGSATSGSWSPPTGGDYELTATITDSTGASKTSLVRQLHVSNPPLANAGSDLVLTQPASSATLQGSGYEQGGTIVSYSWSQSPGDPTNVTFSSKTVAQPTVSGLTAVGQYHFQLIVTDAQGNVSLADEVVVTVQAAATSQPGAVTLAANEVGLVALWGQSNELSNSDKAALAYAPLSDWAGDVAQVFANVRILNTSTNNLESLQDGVNTRPAEDGSYPFPNSFHTSNGGVWLNGISGQEYTFEVITRCYFIAKRFKELYPTGQLVIVQGAVGGVLRSRFLKANNDLYPRFGNMITRAKQVIASEGKMVRFLAMDCTQGEADQKTDVATYNTQMRQIWTDLVADYATSETQLIEFGIPQTGDTGTFVTNPHNGTKATWAGEDNRRHYLAADFVALEEDRIHWNAASQAYAAYNVVALAFKQSLGFPAATTPTGIVLNYDSSTSQVTITPPSNAWLKREFYYQIGSAAPQQLINYWTVILPATAQIGTFKVWSRAVPGRAQSQPVSNTVVWTVSTTTAPGAGPTTQIDTPWVPAKGKNTALLSGNTLARQGGRNGWADSSSSDIGYSPILYKVTRPAANYTGKVLTLKMAPLAAKYSGVGYGVSRAAALTDRAQLLPYLYVDNANMGLDTGALSGTYQYNPGGTNGEALTLAATVDYYLDRVEFTLDGQPTYIAAFDLFNGADAIYIYGVCYGTDWFMAGFSSALMGCSIQSSFLVQV